MRQPIVVIVAAMLLQWVCAAPGQAAPHPGAQSLPTHGDINLPYPANIDLEQDPSGWTYRLNQNQSPLYMSSADPVGKSACNGACAKRWVPVIAQADAKPLGDWSLVVRKDGHHQWAFQGHPVYTYARDSSQKPTGATGTFHVMPHFH